MEPLSDFSRKRIFDILGNDIQLMSEILDIVKQDFPNHIVMLGQAIEDKDYTSVYETAHTLKGSLANIGAERGSSLAAAILASTELEDFEKCAELYPVIQDSVEQFLKEFERYIHSTEH